MTELPLEHRDRVGVARLGEPVHQRRVEAEIRVLARKPERNRGTCQDGLTEAEASWPETTIAAGDTAAEIARLKAEPGGPILAHGGISFARSLIQLGLVDEYGFMVVPAYAGKGTPLFTDFTRLRLVSSKAFSSGLLELVYAPASTGR